MKNRKVGTLNLLRDKIKAKYLGGGKGKHPCPRLVQKVAEGKLSLRVEVGSNNGVIIKTISENSNSWAWDQGIKVEAEWVEVSICEILRQAYRSSVCK